MVRVAPLRVHVRLVPQVPLAAKRVPTLAARARKRVRSFFIIVYVFLVIIVVSCFRVIEFVDTDKKAGLQSCCSAG